MTQKLLFDLIEQWKRDNPTYEQAQEIMREYHRIVDPQWVTVSGPTTGRLVQIRTQETTSGYMWKWIP